MSKPKTKGRPKGAQTVARVAADVLPSRCPKCQSTAREPYAGHPRVADLSGMHDGQPFNRIVYRNTRCTACGQARVDREWRYEPPAEILEDDAEEDADQADQVDQVEN
jgi:hypothetical protein